jgi:AraC family transcriptional regulator, activator of mtrCDE
LPSLAIRDFHPLTALFNEPARSWTLSELAPLCNMSRATFIRHFQERLGRSASDLLTDIHMTVASNALKTSDTSTAAVAKFVGYQSEAAFQRAFKQRMGTTAAQWRRQTPSGDSAQAWRASTRPGGGAQAFEGEAREYQGEALPG